MILDNGNTVNVFTEPPGGWSGTLHEAAILGSVDGQGINSIAVSGRTLVASTSQTLEVFTMPAAGWSGQLQPSAVLSPAPNLYGGLAGPVAISGGVIVAAGGGLSGDGRREAVYVFSKPHGGWRALSHPSAILTFAYGGLMVGPSVAASDGVVAFTTATPDSSDYSCPCSGELYAVTRPLDGWSGTSTASPLAQFNPVYGGPNVALANTTVALGANGVHVLSAASTQATISRPGLTQLQTRTPHFRFTVTAAPAAAPTRTVTLMLPSGLRLVARPSTLRHRISTSGARIRTIQAHANKLAITLNGSSRLVTLAIDSGALRESSGLNRAIIASAKHRNVRWTGFRGDSVGWDWSVVVDGLDGLSVRD